MLKTLDGDYYLRRHGRVNLVGFIRRIFPQSHRQPDTDTRLPSHSTTGVYKLSLLRACGPCNDSEDDRKTLTLQPPWLATLDSREYNTTIP